MPLENITLLQLRENNPSLQKLEINWAITSDKLAALASALESNTVLETLVLEQKSFPWPDISQIIRAISVNRTIKHLKLKYITLDLNCINLLLHFLESNSALESLSLIGNSLSRQNVNSIFQLVTENQSIREFSLSHTYIDTLESHNCIANLLRNNKTLRTLNLSSNNIDTSGGIIILNELVTNKTLWKLNLSKNLLISPTGRRSKEFIDTCKQLIRSNMTLQGLYLRDCNLHHDFANGVAPQLRSTKLQELDLSRNGFGSSCNVIYDALIDSSTLHTLRLENTSGYVSNLVESNLITFLNSNKSVRVLDVRNEPYTFKGEPEKLVNAISQNRVLRELYIITPSAKLDDFISGFESALQNNYTLLALADERISSSNISRFLFRNQVISECFVYCHRYYDNNVRPDVDVIGEHIAKLEEVFPEGIYSLPNTSYPVEVYRLLNALKYCFNGNPLAALGIVEVSFVNSKLHDIADRLFAESLYNVVQPILMKKNAHLDILTLKKYYQLLAYNSRMKYKSSEFACGIVGISKLDHGAAVLDFEGNPRHLPNSALWLPFDVFLEIASESLAKIDPELSEATLLHECIKHRPFSPVTVDALFKCPTFVELLSAEYSREALFQCLEGYLGLQYKAGLTNPYNISIVQERNRKYPLDDATVERYRRNMEGDNDFGLQEELALIKQELLDTLFTVLEISANNNRMKV